MEKRTERSLNQSRDSRLYTVHTQPHTKPKRKRETSLRASQSERENERERQTERKGNAGEDKTQRFKGYE